MFGTGTVDVTSDFLPAETDKHAQSGIVILSGSNTPKTTPASDPVSETLVLIKPDAVERKLVGAIISLIEKSSLTIEDMQWRLGLYDKLYIKLHYQEHKGKDFYPGLIAQMTSGPIVTLRLSSKTKNAVSEARELLTTVRKEWSEGGPRNCMHASDSDAAAAREIKLWFES